MAKTTAPHSVWKRLERKLIHRNATVGIIGLGYVGLPLAVAFAKSGLRVIGYDVQASKVSDVGNGNSYIEDVSSSILKQLVKKGLIRATTNISELRGADAVVICVPTPLTKHHEPDISYVETSARAVASVLQRGQLIVLESTTFPGTTEEVVLPILAAQGLRVGKDFFLAFSPERVDPGNKDYGTANTPKVVGGVTKRCTRLATLLYTTFNASVYPVSSPRVAEMEKLLENIFRVVNVSMVNELALLAGRMNIDIWEVIDAAGTKPYGFMKFFPGPGIGGHCIPIDPFYLSWKAKEYNFSTRFIDLAGEINEHMPKHVITKITYALNQHKKALNGSRILVIGVAYKKDISDVRESPALRILELLEHKGVKVSYHDPHVPKLRLGVNEQHSVPLQMERLSGYDCVVIITDHSSIDFGKIAKKARLIVDTRNAIRNRSLKNVYRL